MSQAAKLLQLHRHYAQELKARSVDLRLARWNTEPIATIGLEQKSLVRAQHYVIVLPDPTSQAVKVDIWQKIANSPLARLPQARIIYALFHVFGNARTAVAKTRRSEHQLRQREGAGFNPRWLALRRRGQRPRLLRHEADMIFSNLEGLFA